MYLGETVKHSAGFCGHLPDSWPPLPAASSCDDPEAAQFSLCAACIADMASLISIKCSIPTAVGKSIPFGLLSTNNISSPQRVSQKLSDSASGAASPSRFGVPSVREKRERTADVGNAQAARPTKPLAKGGKQKPRTSRKDTGMVWEFLRRLLQDPRANPAIIRWESRQEGRFRLVKPEEVARRWGAVKGNSSMNYEKFGRAMRYQYKIKTLKRAKQKLVYKFGTNASGWQGSDGRAERSTKEGVA